MSLLDAALWYASLGLPVLPLHNPTPDGPCSCGAACDRIGKHPRTRRGLHDASTDLNRIRAWWRRWPDANIGVRTGILVDACDIDGPAGERALRELLIDLPFTAPTVRTGSGGWHLWLAPTGHGNRGRLLPDVDWRGTNGYVVVPPSLHASQQRYRWVRPLSWPLPACPARLAHLIKGEVPTERRVRAVDPIAAPRISYATAALERELAAVRSAQRPLSLGGIRRSGERNNTLNRAAFNLGQLVADHLLDASATSTALLAAALDAGLGAAEAGRTIASGLVAGMAKPRRRREIA